jgi:hypothetical protein
VAFRVLDELAVPDDLNLVRLASAKAPARLAFWAYQAAVLDDKLRAAKLLYDRLRGMRALAWRRALDGHDLKDAQNYGWDSRIYGLLDNYLAQDTELVDARRRVDRLQKHRDVVCCIRDAVEHRTFILRKLLTQDSETRIRG